jgi:hypothetical protein
MFSLHLTSRNASGIFLAASLLAGKIKLFSAVVAVSKYFLVSRGKNTF